jgi:hypothetical protein
MIIGPTPVPIKKSDIPTIIMFQLQESITSPKLVIKQVKTKAIFLPLLSAILPKIIWPMKHPAYVIVVTIVIIYYLEQM